MSPINATNGSATSSNLAATHGFANSNHTSNIFLGAPQRPWMVAPVVAGRPVQRSSNPPPRPTPPTPQRRNHFGQQPVQNGSDLPLNATVSTSASYESIGNSILDGRVEGGSPPTSVMPESNNLHHFAVTSSTPAESAQMQQLSSANTEPAGVEDGLGAEGASSVPSQSLRSCSHPPQLSAPSPTQSAPLASLEVHQTLSPSASPPPGEQTRKRPPSIAEQDAEPSLRKRTNTNSSAGAPSLPTVALASPVSQPSTPRPTLRPFTAAVYTPKLDSIQHQLTSMGKWTQLVEQRTALLRDACYHDDLFFLCLHQISTKQTLEPLSAMELAFEAAQLRGFEVLDAILLSNRILPQEAIWAFANFPNPAENLARSHELAFYINQARVFLPILFTQWNQVRQECLTRRFPPCARELRLKLSVPSVVLQKTFFYSIFRQLDPLGTSLNNPTQQQAFNYFYQDQLRHLQKLKQPDGHEARDNGTLEQEIYAFGRGYFQLRKQLSESRRGPARPQESHAPAGVSSRSNNSQTISNPPSLAFSGPGPSAYLSSARSIGQPHGRSTPQEWNSVMSPSLVHAAPPSASSHQPGSQQVQLQQQARSRTRQAPRGYLPPPTPVALVNPSSMEAVSALSNQLHQNYATPQRPTYQSLIQPFAANAARPRSGLFNAPNTSLVEEQVPTYLQQEPTYRVIDTRSQPHQPLGIANEGQAFFPPTNWFLGMTTNPDPNRIALHQALLRSPVPMKLNLKGLEDKQIPLYQYFANFVLSPQLLPEQIPFFKFDFDVPSAAIAELCRDLAPPADRLDLPIRRVYRQGSMLYRMRCVQLSSTTSPLTETDWNIKATSWPSTCFVSIDGIDLEIRRKAHHGRDLAIDLTSKIREGRNRLNISVHFTPEERKNLYCVAVELVKVIDHQTAVQLPTRLRQEDALTAITLSLAHSGQDDELELLDQHVSIDLVDPFMSKIFNIPARGKNCTHRECFDLEAFLQSRTCRTRGGPTDPDQWRCPMCKKDARPPELVVDEFLLGVREKLEKDNMLEARAILVAAAGTWEAKCERDPEDTTKKSSEAKSSPKEESGTGDFVTRRTVTPATPSLSLGQSSTPEIIEIDD